MPPPKNIKRSRDLFEALEELRLEQETARSSRPSVYSANSDRWPASRSATGLDDLELPNITGDWRIVGDSKHGSVASKYSHLSTAPTYSYNPSTQSLVPHQTRPFPSDSVPSLAALRTPVAMQKTPEVAHSMSRLHEMAFIINVCLAQLFSLAALAQTVGPLPMIADYFGTRNLGQLSWFTAAYSLTVGTFILPSGRLGDMYGHRRLFISGWAWLAISSLICGSSSDHIMLSGCRALQGIGPALLVPNAMALVGRTFPIGMKRNLVFSLFGACGPTGFVVGATFSSICAQLGDGILKPSGWAWSFFFLAIASTMVGCASIFIIPSTEQPIAEQRKFDTAGCITGVSGLILINFAWNQAPLVGWQTQYTYLLLIMGLVFMGAFVYTELHIAEQPLVPLRGMQKEVAFVLGCIAAGWASHGIWIYCLFLFIERLRGHTALSACAQTFPVAITGTCAALSVGILLRKMHVAYVMVLAMLFFTIGTVLIATAPVDQTYWAQTFLSVILMPGGMNLSFPAGTILLSNALPREHQGIAASLITTMVNYSISTGLGIAGTVVVHVDHSGQDLLAGFRGAWYFGTGLCVLGLVISLWFVHKSRI